MMMAHATDWTHILPAVRPDGWLVSTGGAVEQPWLETTDLRGIVPGVSLAMGEIVRDAMKPDGWEVQVCYSCGGPARALRLVADASDAPPPERVTETTPPSPQGRLEFGAIGTEILQYAYHGLYDFAKDKGGPHTQLRLLANIQSPTYYMVAVDAKSDITDLRQIAERRLPVKLVARGGVNEAINAAVLDYYGLSDEKIKALNGTASGSYPRGSDVDVIIGWAALINAPEYAVWYDAPQQHELRFLELPADLRATLAKAFSLQEHPAPAALLRGVTRAIPTVAREGTAVYARADLPDDFAYAVVKALDERQTLFRWSHLPFSYNQGTVWKCGDVPLHPGAARYYKKRGYMK
jgi:TRAP transporter TAXI family solute receptor